ncbi:Maltose permease MAL31 [Tolypocladium ophioglossoides CBS 100239]|uniref:Maltose permease MAL31 n=1 Tax=Tolypocladium ophioglossoides (strain CBS 100239) TaxID=1163406 RepID=A0A0L0NCT2_TOLOC|nr:Maltose permease MAL31 [Tolypocladium ophioglossoides CBS 100239]
MDKSSATTEDMPDNLRQNAEAATSWEHSLTTRRALKIYSKAVWWSVVMSIALVMEGYDNKLLGTLYAQPAFQKAYGFRQPNGSYQISAPWQSGMGGISGVTSILGMFLAGYLTERFGFRRTMMAALLSMPPSIFIFFFAPSMEVLAVGNFLLTFPLGIFQTVTTVYVAELMPTRLRPYLTSFYSLVWAVGQLLSAVVLRGTLNLPAPWAYRVPFALQWLWPVVLIFGAYLAPESPWWLVRQNRLAEAEAVVSRLTSEDMEFETGKIVDLMVFTTNHEREIESSTSYLACFKGTNLRRTIIVIGVYIMQVMTGSLLRSYMTYFFQQAGLPTDQSFNMSIVGLALSVLGVLGSWVVMTFIGRRTMYLWGIVISMAFFMAIGGMGVKLRSSPSSALSWAIGSLLAVDGFVANLLVLPVTFVLVSEIPSSLLRSKSVVVARNSYTVVNILAGTITPYMLNPSAWNWGAMTGFFWGGACILGFLFTFFLVPETKDRTTAEVDILFEKKVSVRKFKDTKVYLSQIDEGNGLP